MLAAVVGFWVFPVILKYLDKFEFSSEDTLQHHDTYLLEAIEMIQESIVILTPDLKIVRGNQASKLLLGDALNTFILKCIHPDDEMLFVKAMKLVMGSCGFTPTIVELRVRRGGCPAASLSAADLTTLTIPEPYSVFLSTNRSKPLCNQARVYCTDNNSNSYDTHDEDDKGYMWIECTLCKGARDLIVLCGCHEADAG